MNQIDANNHNSNIGNELNSISKYFISNNDKSNMSLTGVIMKNQNIINSEIIEENTQIQEEIPLEKVQKFFKKNIKLRNATIKKNFWKRDYISKKPIKLKITNLIPSITGTQGLLLCISNYIHNDERDEILCNIINQFNTNTLNENFSIINNNQENTNLNLLMNPKLIYDKKIHKKNKYTLIECIYRKIKKLKKELSKSGETFLYNFLTFKRKKLENKLERLDQYLDIKSTLYTVFPNINFELMRIKKISVSSKFNLNKLLMDKHHSTIKIGNQSIINGFISMTAEKRIITLTDDTTIKNLENSQSLKQIIFGIWISLKNEDPSLYDSIEELLEKNKYLIYKKCFEFILVSSKIETIFSPSPDEGMFILILFFKGSQHFYEVKVIPNEIDKNFNDLEGNNSVNNNIDNLLENYSNQWIIMKRDFTLKENIGFDLSDSMKNVKIDSTINYINYLNGLTPSSKSNSLKNTFFTVNTNNKNLNTLMSQNTNKFISSSINNNMRSNNYQMKKSNIENISKGYSNNNVPNNNNDLESQSNNDKNNNNIKDNGLMNILQTKAPPFDPLQDIFDINFSNEQSNINNLDTINENTNNNNNINKLSPINNKSSLGFKIPKSKSGRNLVDQFHYFINDNIEDNFFKGDDFNFNSKNTEINFNKPPQPQNNILQKFPSNEQQNKLNFFSQSNANYNTPFSLNNNNNQILRYNSNEIKEEEKEKEKDEFSKIKMKSVIISQKTSITPSPSNSNTQNFNFNFKDISNNNKLNYNNNLIIKKDAEVQTIPIDDNIGNILEEQSQTIQMLQKKINNMESMLDKVLIKLREKNKNNNYENYIKEEKENSELELSNNNDDEKSESLNSSENSKEKLNLSNQITQNYINQNIKNENIDYKNKEISSELSISISYKNNNNDITYKTNSNHNEQTLEVPVIKYNSEISGMDDTENDL
jgi:hypothetical protein